MIHTEIRCDACGTIGRVQGHVYLYWDNNNARNKLKERGWEVNVSDGKDYCPSCWRVKKEKIANGLMGLV